MFSSEYQERAGRFEIFKVSDNHHKNVCNTTEKVRSNLALETSSKFIYKIRQLAMYINAICVLFLLQEYYSFFMKQFLGCISAQAPQKAITRP